ncbi:MAG: Rne/Rng family ribonuclease [Bacteroidales bacterium]|nr:Rne/Rng family ribonuclease [Bacteroidales bacterium]
MPDLTKELVITKHPAEVQIALLENKRLVELHQEKSTEQFSVGNIYVGKVRKIMPGLNAAFVNIGCDKDAFLHYLDIGPNTLTLNEFVKGVIAGGKRSLGAVTRQPALEKNGKISDVLSTGQSILVQIAKECISTKGPRITTEISFAGRYTVLVPYGDKVFVSQKIKGSAERKRLRQIVAGFKPRNFGVIVRTVAEGKTAEDLEKDINQLVKKWQVMIDKLVGAEPPVKVASELDRTSSLIRDIVNDSFHAIYVDNKELFEEVKTFMHSFSDGKDVPDIVKLYKDKTPIFEHFNVAKQIKSSFGKVVTIKNGIYLVIEQTEALCVIDVNSGNRVKSSNSQEENALQVNLAAADEIARQMRLRDIGGIIVVDFIDMSTAVNRTQLYKHMAELMTGDRARHTVLPLSKFGLMQITRQRIRPVTTIDILERCPVCQGTGKIKPAILIEENLENIINFLFQEQREGKITIELHPILYAYFTKGLISKQVKWFFRYKKWIRLRQNTDCHLLQYKFFNQDMEEIVLWDSQPKTQKGDN